MGKGSFFDRFVIFRQKRYFCIHHLAENSMSPSLIFYIIFAVPYIIFMYWLVKQDKHKYAWGLAIITVVAILAIYVSQKASKVAMDNYQQHQIDSREIEREERLQKQQDSINHAQQ
ncbi:MAG: hypothetical protein K0R59_4336 [Sphingobacterium sp.]|nr:hypothetical protein [Sphingobacterium sp.]